MPEQIGAPSPALYGQDVSRYFPMDQDIPGSAPVFITLQNSIALDTASLSPVVLKSYQMLANVVGLNWVIYSSAIVAGGANINVGVYKNGVLQGALHTHNGTSQVLSRMFDVERGDIIEIRGNTDDVAVTCRVIWIQSYIGRNVPPTRPSSWIQAII